MENCEFSLDIGKKEISKNSGNIGKMLVFAEIFDDRFYIFTHYFFIVF